MDEVNAAGWVCRLSERENIYLEIGVPVSVPPGYAMVGVAMYWNRNEYGSLVGDGWRESERGIWRRDFLAKEG